MVNFKGGAGFVRLVFNGSRSFEEKAGKTFQGSQIIGIMSPEKNAMEETL